MEASGGGSIVNVASINGIRRIFLHDWRLHHLRWGRLISC